MKRLMLAALAALAAAAFAGPAFAEDVADLRQPAIDKCVSQGNPNADQNEERSSCTCLVDAIIEKAPGEDGVKLLKLIIAAPKDVNEAGVAIDMPAADVPAFVQAHQQTLADAATKCAPKQ